MTLRNYLLFKRFKTDKWFRIFEFDFEFEWSRNKWPKMPTHICTRSAVFVTAPHCFSSPQVPHTGPSRRRGNAEPTMDQAGSSFLVRAILQPSVTARVFSQPPRPAPPSIFLGVHTSHIFIINYFINYITQFNSHKPPPNEMGNRPEKSRNKSRNTYP